MSVDGEGVRASSTEREIEQREDSTAAVRGGSTTRNVLGGLLGLLLLAGALYYFSADRADTTVATGPGPKPSSESSATAPQPQPSASAEKTVAAAPPPQPASPQSPPPEAASSPPPEAASPPSSVAASPPPPAASAEETPKAPPATTAQNSTNNAPDTNAAAAPAEAGGQPAATTQAPDVAQQPMRDQPAALPDQTAAAPKNEITLVVKRGPANIRSAPGKSGRVIGTAVKDAQLKEISRSGNWVEVETQTRRGWINAALLAPAAPDSR